MKKDHWVTAALTNDAVVVELLIRLKQQQTSLSQPPLLPSITWGHRKSRSRPQPSNTAAAAVVNGGFRKEQQQSGSPTTPLCWTSEDGYDESSRPSDLSSDGCRSTKDLASMRCTMSNQVAIGQNFKKFKIDLHQNSKKEMEKMSKMVNCRVQTSCMMAPETKADETVFVLPDLNMAPDEEEL